MSYIEKSLLPDEQIIYRTKKHWIIFFTPIMWALMAIVLFVNHDPLIAKFAIVPVIGALLTGLNQWLIYVTSDFAVTNKRVLMKEGFFFRHANELRLATVSNMTINQGILGQLLNYGTIIINPFGGNNDIFSEITNPLEFQKQTQSQLDQLGK